MAGRADIPKSKSGDESPHSKVFNMRYVVCLLSIGIVHATRAAEPAKDAERFARWEKDIAAIEKRLKDNPPEKGGVIFAGSSTIRLWDVAKAFPDWKPVNVGFGGSQIRDVTHFADRIILKHEPRAIVFYSGDNDINSGRTPDQVLADTRAFADTIHKQLPKTRIHIISIKPSIARWKQFETQTKANALVKEFCSKNERLGYIDVVPAILGDGGQPRPELFVKDGLHFTAKGYEALNDAVMKGVK
jgi:hypothetical protein